MPKRSRNRSACLLNRRKKARHIRSQNNLNVFETVRNNNSNIDNSSSNNENNIVNTTSDLLLESDDNHAISSTYESNDDDDVTVPKGDTAIKAKHEVKIMTHSQRWSVYYLFQYKYRGMSPPEELNLYDYWSGKGGVASKIQKDLGLSTNFKRSRLIRIFEKIMDCVTSEIEFKPEMVENRGGNRQMKIRIDSPEAQIMADSLEGGLSIHNTWININMHRLDNGYELISKSCVLYALQKMKPRVVRIKKRKQGSSDPNSAWSLARNAWCTQLLARFGKLQHVHGPIERRFQREIVGKLDIHQIVWWDETHRKCLIGGITSHKDFNLQFPRNKNGRLDVVNGEYSNEEKSVLNVKYEKECRLGLGVAVVVPLAEDGTSLPHNGRRCHPFNYTTKVLISVDDYKRLKKVEIKRVKNLTGRLGVWIESQRIKGVLYRNDTLNQMKGVGQKTVEKLKLIGIKTVNDLRKMTNLNDVILPDGLSVNID